MCQRQMLNLFKGSLSMLNSQQQTVTPHQKAFMNCWTCRLHPVLGQCSPCGTPCIISLLLLAGGTFMLPSTNRQQLNKPATPLATPLTCCFQSGRTASTCTYLQNNRIIDILNLIMRSTKQWVAAKHPIRSRHVLSARFGPVSQLNHSQDLEASGNGSSSTFTLLRSSLHFQSNFKHLQRCGHS